MPGKAIPKVGWKIFIQWDKVAHFSLYGLLAMILALRLVKKKSDLTTTDVIIVATICSIYGAILEAIQYFFLSDRFFEIPDIIANIIGSIAGSVFVYLFLKR